VSRLKVSWRWRGMVALTAVALAFVIYPLTEPGADVINSDWPAFATGAKLIVSDPAHLYDLDAQQRVQLEVTGGRQLVTYGIHGILPFLAPAWVALIAAPFEALGTELGGRVWILFGLACLALGLWLATRPRAPAAILPAFASVPTALFMLNAQLDGIVVLGLGAAVALWSRPYLAGLALGLTLMKPHLVLALGLGLLLARQWRQLAGWATAGVVLTGAAMLFNPHWILDWLTPLGTPVQPGSREIDIPHFGTLLPAEFRTDAIAVLTVLTLFGTLVLARRRADDFNAVLAILIAGGVLAAPHALPADFVLVAFALALWGKAEWHDWVILSAGAVVAAVTPAPVPAIAGLLVVGWLLVRLVSTEARTKTRGERFGDPGGPDAGEATSSGASAS